MTEASPAERRPDARVLLVLIAGAYCVDMTLYGLVVPFLPGYAVELGLSESAVGALFATYAVALLAGAWLVSWLAVRVPGRTLLVGGALTLSVSIAVFALARAPWLLFSARALQGVASAVPWTVGPALIAELFPAERRGRAMGLTQSGSGIGMLLGPPLGGVLYAAGGYLLPFAVTAGASLLLTLAFAVVLRHSPLRPEPMPASAPGVPRPGPLGVVRQPTVALASAAIIVGGGVLAGIEPVLPLDFEARFASIEALETGFLFGALVICYATTVQIAGRLSDRIGSRLRLSALGLCLMGLTLPAIAIAPSVLLCAVAMALHGIALSLTLSPTMPSMADGIDQLRRGGQHVAYATVYVVFNSAYGVGMFLGPSLVAAASEASSVRTALGGLAVVCAATGLALAVARARLRA